MIAFHFFPSQQFLEKEHCEENILFFKEAREFAEKTPHLSPVQAQAAAKKIYDQYLSPASPHTVNVDDRALKAVESGLDSPTPGIFAEAQEQVGTPLRVCECVTVRVCGGEGGERECVCGSEQIDTCTYQLS